jgi:hypothetical protein
VWGGHSCPPPLTLGFSGLILSQVTEIVFTKPEAKSKAKIKSKIKGGGQECPPYTGKMPHIQIKSLFYHLPGVVNGTSM